MSKTELNYEKDGMKLNISGEGAEITEIAKLVLNPVARVSLAIPRFEKFGFEVEEPMKSKSIIKKVNAHTVEVEGQRLSLRDCAEVKPGTDWYVFEKDGEYFLNHQKAGLDLEPIGGFHYGLIPEDFEARNNISSKDAKKIAGINAYSIWDEKHRPVCNPGGMVYIPKLDIWIDIYLCNSNHKSGTSQSSGHIAAGYEDEGRKVPEGEKNLSKKVRIAIAKYHNKKEISKDEFQVVADGVKENESARDLDDGTIKHMDDFTSKYGLCQATGVQWTWSRDNYKDKEEAWWILGGTRGSGCYAGSRYAIWLDCDAFWDDGCRFVGDSLNPVK